MNWASSAGRKLPPAWSGKFDVGKILPACGNFRRRMEDLLRCRQANFLHDSFGEASFSFLPPAEGGRRQEDEGSGGTK